MSGEAAFNAADEAVVEAASRGARGAERELNRALTRVMDTREGRLVLWWVVRDLSGWFEQTFTGDETTYFNEGRRQVGTEVVKRLLGANPRSLGDLITEMTEGWKA